MADGRAEQGAPFAGNHGNAPCAQPADRTERAVDRESATSGALLREVPARPEREATGSREPRFDYAGDDAATARFVVGNANAARAETEHAGDEDEFPPPYVSLDAIEATSAQPAEGDVSSARGESVAEGTETHEARIPTAPPASTRSHHRLAPTPLAPTSNGPSSSRAAPVPYIVLVALDLSEPGGRAWRFAFDLAQLRGETEIHAVVVGARGLAPRVRDLGVSLSSTSVRNEPIALPPLKVLQHQSAGGQARLMAMHYRTGRPDKAIVRLAREISADLIVVAKQEATRLERLFGLSTADRIARTAPCPVVVVKPKNDDEDVDYTEFEPRRAAG